MCLASSRMQSVLLLCLHDSESHSHSRRLGTRPRANDTSMSPQQPQRWRPLPHFNNGETEGLKVQVVCSRLKG